MTGVLRRGELEAVKTWVQLSLKTPRSQQAAICAGRATS